MGVLDFLVTPFVWVLRSFYEFLTSPKTIETLSYKMASSIGQIEYDLYAYRVPYILTTLGGYLLLAGLAVGLYKALVTRSFYHFIPLALLGIAYNFFAFKGVPCADEGYPCTPDIKLVRGQQEIALTTNVPRLTIRGNLPMDTVDGREIWQAEYSIDNNGNIIFDPNVIKKESYTYYSIDYSRVPMPLGTGAFLAALDLVSTKGRYAFYAELVRYNTFSQKYLDIYRQMMTRVFSMAVLSDFMVAISGKVGEYLLNLVLPPFVKNLFGKVLGKFKNNAKPPFPEKKATGNPSKNNPVGQVVGSTVGGIGASWMERMAEVIQQLLVGIVAVPLTIYMAFLGMFFLLLFVAKLALFAVPLILGGATLLRFDVPKLVSIGATLMIAPFVLGTFLSLTTRMLWSFTYGKQGPEMVQMEKLATQMRLLEQDARPHNAVVTSQALVTILNSLMTMENCLNPGGKSPGPQGDEINQGGYVKTIDIGGSVTYAYCYPSFYIADLTTLETSNLGSDAIKQTALKIARSFSLDFALALARSGNDINNFTAVPFALPKGVFFVGNDKYLLGVNPLNPPGIWGAENNIPPVMGPVPFYRIVYLGNPNRLDPSLQVVFSTYREALKGGTVPPIEASYIVRRALSIATNQNPTPADLEKLLSDVKQFEKETSDLIKALGQISITSESTLSENTMRKILDFGLKWEIAWPFDVSVLREVAEQSGVRSGFTPIVLGAPQGDIVSEYSYLEEYKKNYNPANALKFDIYLPPNSGERREVYSLFQPRAIEEAQQLVSASFFPIGSGDKAVLVPYYPYILLDRMLVLSRLGGSSEELIKAMHNWLLMGGFLGLMGILVTVSILLFLFNTFYQLTSVSAPLVGGEFIPQIYVQPNIRINWSLANNESGPRRVKPFDDRFDDGGPRKGDLDYTYEEGGPIPIDTKRTRLGE